MLINMYVAKRLVTHLLHKKFKSKFCRVVLILRKMVKGKWSALK